MHSSSPSVLCAKCLSKLDHLSDPLISETSQMISSHARNGYNLPLSPKEIAQIDTFLVDGSEGLSEYETAIAEVEGLLISLKNSRDRLQRRCDSARYLISAPIRRLPLDVLHEIFTLFCEMDVPDSARYGASGVYNLYIANEVYCPTLKLTWVCSFWRTFIQSCPNLWSSICVDAATFTSRPNSLQVLVKYLSQSAGSLLDFHFTEYFNSEVPIVQEAIALLWNCSTRWRRAFLYGKLFLKAGATLMIKSSEPTQTQSRSFPALEGLEIMSLDRPSQESFFQSFSPCPRLRVVKLARFSWSGHNADFSCVTSLTLDIFVGKSFGHLLRRLPVLESLQVHNFELYEDDVDDGSYMSSLTTLTVSSSALQPIAWRSTRLPHLTDVTFTLSEYNPLEELLTLSSILHDSQCRLNKLDIVIYDDRSRDFQSPTAILDFIASQNYLTHLAITTCHIDPFVEFLRSKEDGSFVIRNLRSLEFNSFVTRNGFEALACSICDIIESRCTVRYSANGNPEISGLQVLTVDFSWSHSSGDGPPSFHPFVHNRLSMLKEAGFKLAESSLV